MRNKYITVAMDRILRWMASDEGDGELVTEGREAWYGSNRTNVATVNALLRLCLISDQTGDGALSGARYHYYTINEEGRAVLRDPDYKPLMVDEWAKRLS